MKQKIAACFFMAGLVMAPAQAAQNSGDVKTVMENVVKDFIRPGYAAFHASAKSLQEGLATLCEAPSPEAHASARKQFSHTATAWAGIEIIRFGPVSKENRFERILFYPDRKSTGLKQVQRILASKDASVLSLDSIQGKSVAVQGLGAIEYLLFGTGSKSLADGDDFRCRFAESAGKNITDIAAGLEYGWSQGKAAPEIHTTPGPGNPVLRTPQEAVNEVLGTLVHGLEAIRDIRIGAFLKPGAGKDRPRVALFRRSGNTLAMIAENIRSARILLEKSHIESLLGSEDQGVIQNVLFDLNNAERAARQLNNPVEEIVANPDQREKLRYIQTALQFAIKSLDEDFAQAAGLSSGFSFSDGD